MEQILANFPGLSDRQIDIFSRMKPVFLDWNARINLISRKDEDAFYTHHVLHSLAIAKMIQFPDNAEIIDIGAGGGFPAMPLAVMFPDARFTLLDSIRKKMTAAESIATELGISNLAFVNERAEKHKGDYHYIIARAVAAFPRFFAQTRHLLKKHPEMSGQGIYYLKGGELSKELKGFQNIRQAEIQHWFDHPFFETKKIVYMPYAK
ncbi:MAG: 16S rRNA (guanine(527)-N(7))-methyltransferase RsmG [Bacteroidota bacterium]